MDTCVVTCLHNQVDTGELVGRVLRYARSVVVCPPFPEAKQRRSRNPRGHFGVPQHVAVSPPRTQASILSETASLETLTRIHANREDTAHANNAKVAEKAAGGALAAASEAAAALQAADALLAQCAPPPRAGRV